MTYKATHEVVQRVRPLLERLATRTIDKARLLQYLSAMAGVDWGALRLIERTTATDNGTEIELLTLEDTVEFFNLVLETKLTAEEKADLVAFLRCL